jgi:hypothetical protein
MLSPALLARTLVTIGLIALTPRAEAEAEPRRACADRTTVVQRLETRFGEVRQAMGLNRGNSVIEVYASAETGSWTILVTDPNGVSCLIASGELWESETGPLARPGNDA